MGVLRVQENIKKDDGTYDVVHKETEAGLVLFDQVEIKQEPVEGDYIPVIDSADNEKMKKFPATALKTNNSAPVAVTLTVDGWSNGSQSVAVEGLGAGKNGVIGLAQNITKEQRDAAIDAELYIRSQNGGTLVIGAYGTVPVVDVPLSILLIG